MLHEEDKSIVCPYNPAHVIRAKRMQFHLIKCRKNYPTLDYAICAMDATHHVPRAELELHYETCSKRSVIDSVMVGIESGNSTVAPPLPKSVVDSLLPESEESWDDINVPTYVPDCSKKNVVRTMKNAPRAQKKEFQREERRRLLELAEESKANAPVEMEPRLMIDDAVRMPKNRSQAFTASHQRVEPK